MSDDEEIVLKNSELYKHILTNNVCELPVAVDRTCLDHSIETDTIKSNLKGKDENKNTSLECKFGFTENGGNIIYIIFKTGLLYPDHIIDLESKVEIKNAKERSTVNKYVGVYLCLVASSSIPVIINTTKVLRFIGCATAAYFSYKIYNVIKQCFDSRRIKRFALAIEHLFSATKKTLSLIIESEFLLRSKIIKEQPFYVPCNGWVNPSTYEGLKYSGLIVPELRKALLSVYLDVVITYDNLLMFMKKTLPLKWDNDKYKLDSLDEYVELQKQNVLAPGSDDLKKLSNMYLVIQSEFLFNFILCYVERLWVNKLSYYNLNCIVAEVIKYVDSFVKHSETLELLYQKCIHELKSGNTQLRRAGILKSCNANYKFYMFIKNFLTKADAHMLSLLLDLRMINDWVNEFEENNKDSNSDCSINLMVTLHDRLELMKSNVHCFSNLYSDNCNILKSMIHPALENSSSYDLNASENKSNNCVTLTGIEVGKSNLDFTGKDEVLISLSNVDHVIGVHDAYNEDYDDPVSQKCLPKSVLDELKFALQVKKKEWLEREKKATVNSDITIDSLDFDNLLHSNELNCRKANVSNDKQICRKLSSSSVIESDSRRCSSDEESSLVGYTTATYDPSNMEDKDDVETIICGNSPCQSCQNDERDQFTTATRFFCEDTEKNETDCTLNLQLNNEMNSSKNENSDLEGCHSFDYDSSEEPFATNSVCRFSTPITFVDQIKYVHKSFNLNMTEEEFLEDCSDGEI